LRAGRLGASIGVSEAGMDAVAIGTWRKEQRAQMLARREAAPESRRRAWDDAITVLLVEGFPSLGKAIVAGYWPFRGEFDPRFAMRHFRQCGARLALPEVVEKRAPLRFRQWWPGVAMDSSGVFGLPVPEGTEAVMPDALLIAPVGFDARGFRLGYGGGYFDRTLAAMRPSPLKIGVAYELSRMPTIHPLAHDIAMDFIVTETGIHRVGERGLEPVPRGEAQAPPAYKG
jgi:5,10-methenyltetrahydrofolate synthetase